MGNADPFMLGLVENILKGYTSVNLGIYAEVDEIPNYPSRKSNIGRDAEMWSVI